MRSLTKTCVVLIVLSMTALLVPLGAQDEQAGGRRGGGAGRAGGAGRGGGRGAAETWWVPKAMGGPSAYKGPMRPVWRLADLKQMHAGRNNWSELIIRDTEQDVTYNSAAPGTTFMPRMHPDTPTSFIVIAGQVRFTVDGQEPTVAKRSSIVHIPKTTVYGYEVIGTENALWVELNILGYSVAYPASGPKPAAPPGASVVAVTFGRATGVWPEGNKFHFNTLDAIANCTVSSVVSTEHMYINPLLGFVNPADNPCGTGSLNTGSGPVPRPGDPRFDTSVPFGHMHGGVVEWWIVQVGKINAKFENFEEIHAVEGDVLYAAPMTWHQMAAEAPSGPSVRLALGAYQRISMQNTGRASGGAPEAR